MDRCFICCAILRPELEKLFAELTAAGEEPFLQRIYLEPALHVDFDKLKQALTGAIEDVRGNDADPRLIYGRLCHPEMEALAEQHGMAVMNAGNCIEMLLGEDMTGIDAEARTFYLTPGWLENWKQIFIGGLGWDAVDARQNFGMYERILLLDTGVASLDEEKILEFFDYTQVPVEIRPVGLAHLRRKLLNLLTSDQFSMPLK